MQGHNIFNNHWNTPFYHNYTRTFETGEQLMAALLAEITDAKILVLHNNFALKFTPYRTSYLFWLSKIGVYRASSTTISEKFAELTGPQIDKIDKFLKNIYIDDKAKYIELMPNGKASVQKGRYSDKILNAVVLADAMLLRTELASISQDFKDFTTDLDTTHKTQRVNKQTVKNASSDLEAKRITLAGGLFWVYGGLIQIYFETPSQIARYYEINQMFAKKAGQDIINPDVVVVDLAPLETKEAGMNFVPTDVINASVVGNGDIEFWITDGSPANANTKKGIIHAGEEFLIRPPEWATSDCRYLYFKCTDTEFSTSVHLVKVIPVM